MRKKPPSVNDLALSMQDSGIPHELLVKEARLAIAEGNWENIGERVEHLQRSFIQPVVNATGVLLHTNLGRASWGVPRSSFSSNIEFNLKNGKKDGLSLRWHKNGQKHVEVNFKDDELITVKYWNSKGEPVDTYEESIK